jgi:hypothetical protein
LLFVSGGRNVFVLRDAYIVLRSAAGGRNEETYSKYAEGIQKIGIRAEGNTSRF